MQVCDLSNNWQVRSKSHSVFLFWIYKSALLDKEYEPIVNCSFCWIVEIQLLADTKWILHLSNVRTMVACTRKKCSRYSKETTVTNDISYEPSHMAHRIWSISYGPYHMNYNRGKSLIDNVLEQIRFYQMNGSQVRDTFS